MRPEGFGQASSLGLALVTLSFTISGLTRPGLSAALVGETRQVALQPKEAASTDALKALFRRPASIPFPKDNPYTPEKAALGKKLYFDTRLSVTAAQSCGSCHSP